MAFRKAGRQWIFIRKQSWHFPISCLAKEKKTLHLEGAPAEVGYFIRQSQLTQFSSELHLVAARCTKSYSGASWLPASLWDAVFHCFTSCSFPTPVALYNPCHRQWQPQAFLGTSQGHHPCARSLTPFQAHPCVSAGCQQITEGPFSTPELSQTGFQETDWLCQRKADGCIKWSMLVTAGPPPFISISRIQLPVLTIGTTQRRHQPAANLPPHWSCWQEQGLHFAKCSG